MIKTKTIKTITALLLLTLPLASPAQEITQKPKRIYITLDVSGSMDGNKYVMANYTAQTIAVFSNPEDLVYVYYLGKQHNIGSANGYKDLQIPFNRHPGQDTYHEISDLNTFLRNYHHDSHYQDWLFIIGDGDWNYATADYKAITQKLSKLFASGQLQVCYLQTGNTLDMDYPFTEFLLQQNSPLIEIRRSDTTATSVLSNCTFFTNKILGFSNTQVPLQQQGVACVTFRSEFPLDHCVLFYQSDKPNANEVAIASVECGQRRVNYHVKGNPSTKPLVQPGNQVLNGVVWELSSPQTIPANEDVKVCFNQDVKVKNLTLYPYVDVTLRMQPLSKAKDTLVQAGTEFFKICDKDDHVLVKISATDKHNHKFPPPLMQRMNVKIISGRNNDTVTATYSAADTTFQAVLRMSGDTLSYFSTVESPGYFRRVSAVQTVVKDSSACPPERIPLITLPMQRFEAVTFDALLAGRGVEGVINDTLFQALAAAGVFNDKTMRVSDSWMLEDASLSVDGLSITITQKPKNGLCECTFPDTLRYEVTLRSTNGILHNGKLYEGVVIPITVPVDKRGWWDRCWIFLALFFGLLLFIIYLRALRKKHRFGKYASITAIHYNRYGEEDSLSFQIYLRKKNTSAWLSRWFSPADEKYMPSFVTPNVSNIVFIAGETPAYVNVPKSNITPPKIMIPNFDPENDTDSSKFVKLTNNGKIEVMKNEFTKEGYLQYNSGEGGTSSGHKRLSALLMLTAIVAEGFVTWILIKSLVLLLF